MCGSAPGIVQVDKDNSCLWHTSLCAVPTQKIKKKGTFENVLSYFCI